METRIKFGTSRESPASVAHAHLKSPRHRIASSQRNSVDLKITEPKRKLGDLFEHEDRPQSRR